MYRILRRIALGLALLVSIVAGLAAWFYSAATAPVPEYDSLLAETRAQLDAGQLDESRQQLESQIASLVSDAQKNQTWQTVVTAKQVNSWLATQLDEDFPRLQQGGIREPLILITPRAVTLAVQAEFRGIEAVVSLDFEPYVTPEGYMALELSAGRVGSASLPLRRLVKPLAAKMRQHKLPGRWTSNQGRPVLIFDVDTVFDSATQTRSLEKIELREGELFVAGVTREQAPRHAEEPRVAEEIEAPADAKR